jgi:hypothetical protein
MGRYIYEEIECNNKLRVRGTSTLTGAVTMSGGATLSGGVTLSGAVSISSAIPITQAFRTVTASSAVPTATLLTTDRYVLVNASAANTTINLPSASQCTGVIYNVVRTDANTSSMTCTIDAMGNETINGATTKTLDSQYTAVALGCNGTAWFLF